MPTPLSHRGPSGAHVQALGPSTALSVPLPGPAGVRAAQSLQQLAVRDLLAAIKTHPRAGFYNYLVTARDAAHAARNFILHQAWAHPSRVCELVDPMVIPQDLSNARAGNLVGVLFVALTEVAKAKAKEHYFGRGLHAADAAQLQALANHLLAGLQRLPGLKACATELHKLDPFAFSTELNPEELCHSLNSCFHNLSVNERNVDGFWHPMATLSHAAFQHFTPNANCTGFDRLPALPQAHPQRTAAAHALKQSIHEAFLQRRLCNRPLDERGILHGVRDLLRTYASHPHWAVVSELCRDLGAAAHNAAELGLLASLIHGAGLEYAAPYLSTRHMASTREHLQSMADAMGREMHAWSAHPQLRSDLDAMAGLTRSGYAQRTAPTDLAANVGCYGNLLNAYLRPRGVEDGGPPEDIEREHFAQGIGRVMNGPVANEIEGFKPVHGSFHNLRDSF